MRSLLRPSDGQLIEYLMQAAELPLNGSSTSEDLLSIRHSVPLGQGATAYRRAVAHLLNWAFIPTDLVEFFWAQRPLIPGTTVATGMWVRRFYWVNPCRITSVSVEPNVAAIDDPSLTSESLGDARARVVWHTVEGHSLAGEQAFTVIHSGETGEVEFEVTGLAEPVAWLRMHSKRIHALRHKFAERSCHSMQRAMTGPPPCKPPALSKSASRGV
ncbi:DUF1990 family protein [Candidatus Laterigemmans baculatus]|uniref:DUF1990 family protein n=1 Tax=Candidatus Laterigemmans baculatus TaxID=2770505 RepID=UPI0013DBEF33|nr:DUF1990 family protein [Candidatus Laterigemmans baculatus]